MKIKPTWTNCIVAIALIAIIVLQVLWVCSYILMDELSPSLLIISTILAVGATVCIILLDNTIYVQYRFASLKKEAIESMSHKLKQPITSLMMTQEYLQNKIRKDELSSTDELLEDSLTSLKILDLYADMIRYVNQEGEKR